MLNHARAPSESRPPAAPRSSEQPDGGGARLPERRVPAEDAHVTQPPEPPPPSSSQGPGAQLRGSVTTPRSLYRPSTQQPALGQQPPATEQPPAVDHQLKASVVTGDRVRLVPYCRAHVPRVHQWKQDLELLRPMCKWAGRAETAAEIPSRVHEAFVQMRTDRPGTAVLEIAASELREDVLGDRTLLNMPSPSCSVRPMPGKTEVAAACDLLRAASRPLIWVGAGAAKAQTSK